MLIYILIVLVIYLALLFTICYSGPHPFYEVFLPLLFMVALPAFILAMLIDISLSTAKLKEVTKVHIVDNVAIVVYRDKIINANANGKKNYKEGDEVEVYEMVGGLTGFAGELRIGKDD